MTLELTIRKARDVDAPGIRDVCASSWRDAYADLLPAAYIEANIETFYTPAHLRNEIERPGDLGPWFVAVDTDGDLESSVIGAGRGTPPVDGTCELFNLYVHPNAQGRGIGTTLLESISDRQRRAGGREQVVEVFAEHEEALAFYNRLGFERVDSRPSDIVAGIDPDHRTIRLSRSLRVPL